ncbi:MAG: hypothetical protein HQK86_10740 [Nitrospinae bacterium]|nr:hypothetical protein [Nitrospinota bacterium]MBF0634311.1 hypothetical protein [Nitrospinota bacterium]
MAGEPSPQKLGYLKEIRTWALDILETLKPFPSTAEKLTLLMQVDKLKDITNINESNLPAYAGAVAVLTEKVAKLVRGERPDTIYPREKVISLITSELLRKYFTENPMVMMNLKDFLEVGAKKGASATLNLLSKTGH